MEKLTKNVLKEIVKECLTEILFEGLADNNNARKIASSSNKPAKAGKRKARKYQMENVSKKTPEVSSRLDEIANTARGVTDDPVLADMLADTAKTTLQEQISAESKKGYAPAGSGDVAQKTVDSSTPDELFGAESAGKWAQLAFGG